MNLNGKKSDGKLNSYAEGIEISWVCSADAVRREQRETGVSVDIKMQELYMDPETRIAN